jgi:hypothetical protein
MGYKNLTAKQMLCLFINKGEHLQRSLCPLHSASRYLDSNRQLQSSSMSVWSVAQSVITVSGYVGLV